MSSRSLSLGALLVGFLTFSLFLTTQIGAQNTDSDVRQKLLSAFDAVRGAEQSGAASSDIMELTTELNRALSLQGSDGATSGQVSMQVVSRASVLQQAAQATGLRTAIISYSLAVWAAVLSAVITVDSHRIAGVFRKRKG